VQGKKGKIIFKCFIGLFIKKRNFVQESNSPTFLTAFFLFPPSPLNDTLRKELVRWSLWHEIDKYTQGDGCNVLMFFFLCSVDRASPYNLANETNLVHIFFSQLISSILFITSICFGPLQVYHQEELLYFMWHLALVFCLADCLVCRILYTRQSAVQNTSAKCHIKYSSSSWWWTWRGPKYLEVINNIEEIHWEKNCAPSWFHLKEC